MKRALSTFGNPFGLALYDKEQQNVRGRRKKRPQSSPNGKDRSITWLVLSSEGEYLSAHEDPTDYCKAMRQLLEAISTRERLRLLLAAQSGHHRHAETQPTRSQVRQRRALR